jgi:hypothetical protein
VFYDEFKQAVVINHHLGNPVGISIMPVRSSAGEQAGGFTWNDDNGFSHLIDRQQQDYHQVHWSQADPD